MTSLNCDPSYYKEMLELQEKLRKSEEDRIRLEERFNFMEQESRSRHEACINKLRIRYIEFLEEQRLRDERNHKIIDALDKVDSNLALMSAKTDKLYTLKREYEASLLRAHTNQRVANSVAGDSGVISQDEDKLIKKEIRSESKITSAPLYNYKGNLRTPRSLKNHNRPTDNLELISSEMTSSLLLKPSVYSEPLLQNRSTSSIDYLVQRKNVEQKNLDQLPVHTWKNHYSVDLDHFYKQDLTKNIEAKESSAFRYLEPPKIPQTSKLTALLSSTHNIRENYVGNINNDLASYISKIRNLHTNYDQSLEEVDHEQNTSGDLLNMTLSDDGLDHLPIEERKEKKPDIYHSLAVVNDLVSNNKDTADIENRTQDLPSSESEEISISNPLNVIKPINPKTLIHSTLFDRKIKSVALSNESELMETKIDDNIATQAIKLDQPITDTVSEQSEKIPHVQIHTGSAKEEISENEKISNQHEDKLNNSPTICLVESEDIEKDFQITPNLQDQRIENVEKQMEEIFIDETSNLNNFPQSPIQVTNSLPSTLSSVINNENDRANVESDQGLIEKSQDSAVVVDQLENNAEEFENINRTNVENNEKHSLEIGESDEKMSQHVNQGYEYNQEQYQPEINQDYQYEVQEQFVENTEGHYQYEQYGEYINDPNTQYQAPNNQYQDPNNQYQDPSTQYQDQQYNNNNENQQYLENTNQQYHEYSQGPDQVYEQENYSQDPNHAYKLNDYNYSNQDEAFYQNNSYPEHQSYAPEENQVCQEDNQIYQEENDYSTSKEKVENVLEEQSNIKVDNNEYTGNQSINETSEKDDTLTDDFSKEQNEDISTIRESDTDSMMEVNASNTENEFDFN